MWAISGQAVDLVAAQAGLASVEATYVFLFQHDYIFLSLIYKLYL